MNHALPARPLWQRLLAAALVPCFLLPAHVSWAQLIGDPGKEPLSPENTIEKREDSHSIFNEQAVHRDFLVDPDVPKARTVVSKLQQLETKLEAFQAKYDGLSKDAKGDYSKKLRNQIEQAQQYDWWINRSVPDMVKNSREKGTILPTSISKQPMPKLTGPNANVWVQEILKTSAELARQLEVVLSDPSITTEEASAAVAEYFESVYFPVRSLVLTLWTKEDDERMFSVNREKKTGQVIGAKLLDRSADVLEPLKLRLPAKLFAKSSGQRTTALFDPDVFKVAYGVRWIKDTRPTSSSDEASKNSHLTFEIADVPHLVRDIDAISKVPTPSGVLRAMRMVAAQTILGQMQFYSQILGEDFVYSPPSSCRSRMGMELPSMIDQRGLRTREQIQQDQDRDIGNMLKSLGLLAGSDLDYDRQYAHLIGPPDSENFMGTLPFERPRIAKAGLESLKDSTKTPEPVMDSRLHYWDSLGAAAGKLTGPLFERRAKETLEQFQNVQSMETQNGECVTSLRSPDSKSGDWNMTAVLRPGEPVKLKLAPPGYPNMVTDAARSRAKPEAQESLDQVLGWNIPECYVDESNARLLGAFRYRTTDKDKGPGAVRPSLTPEQIQERLKKLQQAQQAPFLVDTIAELPKRFVPSVKDKNLLVEYVLTPFKTPLYRELSGEGDALLVALTGESAPERLENTPPPPPDGVSGHSAYVLKTISDAQLAEVQRARSAPSGSKQIKIIGWQDVVPKPVETYLKRQEQVFGFPTGGSVTERIAVRPNLATPTSSDASKRWSLLKLDQCLATITKNNPNALRNDSAFPKPGSEFPSTTSSNNLWQQQVVATISQMAAPLKAQLPYNSEGFVEDIPELSWLPLRPMSRSLSGLYETQFPYLKKLWDYCVQKDENSDSLNLGLSMSEWEYMEKYWDTNPWNSMYLGFLLADYELQVANKTLGKNFRPQYFENEMKSIGLLYDPTSGEAPFGEYNSVTKRTSNITHETPNFVMSREEKKKAWEQRIKFFDDSTLNVFSTKDPRSTTGGSFADVLDAFHRTPMWDKNTAVKISERHLGPKLTRDVEKKLDEVFGSTPSQDPQSNLTKEQEEALKTLTAKWNQDHRLFDRYADNVRIQNDTAQGFNADDPYPEEQEIKVSEKTESLARTAVAGLARDFLATDPKDTAKLESLARKINAGALGLDESSRLDGASDRLSTRRMLLDAQREIKKPAMARAVMESARVRRDELARLMESLCGMDPSDEDQFVQIYNHLIESQAVLVKQTGGEIPEEILEQIKSEKHMGRDLGIAGLQIGLFVGMALLAAGCTGATGGLCLPGAAAVMGAVATGTQFVILDNSIGNAIRADRNESLGQQWIKMGFSTEEAVKDSRGGGSWFWAGLDAVSVFPFLGPVIKGGQTYARTAQLSAEAAMNISKTEGLQGLLTRTSQGIKSAAGSPSALRGTTMDFLRGGGGPAARQAAAETEIHYARYRLGLENAWNDLSTSMKRLFRSSPENWLKAQGFNETEIAQLSQATSASQVRTLLSDMKHVAPVKALSGEALEVLSKEVFREFQENGKVLASLSRGWGSTSVRESIDEIDRAFVRTTVDQFDGDPDKLVRFLNSRRPVVNFFGKNFAKDVSEETFDQIAKLESPRAIKDFLAKAGIAVSDDQAKDLYVNGRIDRVIATITSKDFTRSVTNKAIQVRGSNYMWSNIGLEQALKPHAEDLEVIGLHVPKRLRGTTYHVFVSGSPGDAIKGPWGYVPGLNKAPLMSGRIPLLAQSGDAVVFAQNAGARQRLAYDLGRVNLLNTLGLSPQDLNPDRARLMQQLWAQGQATLVSATNVAADSVESIALKDRIRLLEQKSVEAILDELPKTSKGRDLYNLLLKEADVTPGGWGISIPAEEAIKTGLENRKRLSLTIAELLFMPQGASEQHLSSLLWNQAPLANLLEKPQSDAALTANAALEMARKNYQLTRATKMLDRNFNATADAMDRYLEAVATLDLVRRPNPVGF